MIGGAQPQPLSKCVSNVPNSPPQDIPIPKELLGDVITPWPAGTPGPHLGISLAGRFLDHAFVSAYNSGLLCLGISTDQVDQLQSGYLSLLAPSIKFLTFEQGAAAAAISTRPGVPPKVKVGGGTDIKTDPLLTITLEKFAIDFYLYRMDRYVRIFTFTSDLSVPVNLQTGKDPKTNPTGGILPVLGDIKLANPSVTNADLMFEEPVALANGISGLLGGIVGTFLGGGFKPIDISTALASVGLSLDIPAGGIRKLTSGNDDFIGIFANLAKSAGTAHEEADTRASIVEKIIDRDAMSLATADRARFPKLRVHAEGIASHPTEQTWWVDDGPHAAWSQSSELLVDQDAMLLQGHHVLHVSSRVVGVMASEDDTPAEIPFVIDTLAPLVDAKRDGKQITVRAHDYVSADSALKVRHRVTAEGTSASDAGWTEWTLLGTSTTFEAAASASVDVEVGDEEGNIGTVALPLRGRADSSLAAAGSGCGCRVVSAAPMRRPTRSSRSASRWRSQACSPAVAAPSAPSGAAIFLRGRGPGAAPHRSDSDHGSSIRAFDLPQKKPLREPRAMIHDPNRIAEKTPPGVRRKPPVLARDASRARRRGIVFERFERLFERRGLGLRGGGL